MPDLLGPMVVYITTVAVVVLLVVDSHRFKRWRELRRSRRTTREVWARCPASRPREYVG